MNEQIHALSLANTEERVALMNTIKKQLISMNEAKRVEIIEKLRENLEDKLEHEVQDTMHEEKGIEEHTAQVEISNHEEEFHFHHELHADAHHEHSEPDGLGEHDNK
jgi:hypothetical protein